MHVLVLGAGVVGTTTAWMLRQAGHQVTVIERQPGAGLETSFANGGQISVSHAEPWANPHVLAVLWHWLGREDAPLRVRWRYDPDFFRWGLAFLRECLPQRTEANIRAIVHLALYSRACLQALRAALPLDYDARTEGILHIYTDPREFARAQHAAGLMQRFGLDRLPVSVERCLEIEPALQGARDKLVGGDFTASDESGDAHRFTQQLAALAAEAGVVFRYGVTVEALQVEDGVWRGVRVRQGETRETLSADAAVLALGSYSTALLKPCGIRLPVYPGKGYSTTLQLAANTPAPTVSLTDDGRKMVFSRLGNRLRVAGTAEFNGFNLDLDAPRCEALLKRTRELFPDLTWAGEPQFWCGLRPVTPSNVPLIGRSGIHGLWLNTGHGTLGWTMSCGSAAAITNLIGGQPPAVDFPFLRG